MVVLQASGFSQKRLLVYSIVMGALMTIASAYLLLVLNPALTKEKGKILLHSSDDVLQTIVPQSFRVLNDGKIVFYVGQVSHDHKHLSDIFFAQLEPNTQNNTQHQPQQNWTVDYINSADQVLSADNHIYLRTSAGNQYKGVAGSPEYRILNYEHYDVLLATEGMNQNYDRLDGASTQELWQHRDDLPSLAELEWRVSLVLQIVILTLFAVPLSRVKPRQGRYAKFLPAAIFYVVFANLLFLGRFLLENKYVSASIGVWWVFVVMLLIVIVYYAKDFLRDLLFSSRNKYQGDA
jgi:lipopolysaccharide export system permease protein